MEVVKISKILTSLNGLTETTVRSDKRYFCGQTELGKDVVLYDLYDEVIQGSYDQTAFFVSANPGMAGGSDDKNNFLYNCLYDYLGSRLIWDTAEIFRKFLKVKPNEKINICYIEKIEAKLKVPINIRGDHIYVSKIKHPLLTINLILVNEHYSIDIYKVENIAIEQKVSRIERKPLIMNYKSYEAFDGLQTIKMTNRFVNDIYFFKTDYILVKCEDIKLTLKENFNEFIETADILKAETNNEINLYKTGSYNTTALHLFNQYTKHIKQPENIKQVESMFINGASQGALILIQKDTKDQHIKQM
jgi:hypothetical protein